MYLKTYNKEECTACTACVNVCPKSCISMVQDDEGFAYPQIDESICIKCNICEKVCPVAHPVNNNDRNPDTYAVCLKDIEQRKKSSSGGVFYAIASWVINSGGVVYGAAMDSSFQVCHIGVQSLFELGKLRGSKYVQSNLNNVFSEIKKELINNRLVYFVGTGCQVAGLKSFLKKDYNNLIVSDVVCHGVPSQTLFDKHISYLEQKYHGTLEEYSFRDNAGWGGCEIVKLKKSHNKSILIKNDSYELSPYLYSFMHGYTLRYSCYSCPFARVPRTGDLTLADFWGVKRFHQDIDTSYGVSLLLVNTTKGRDVWNAVKEKCSFRIATLNEASQENGGVIKPFSMPKERKEVYRLIFDDGYNKVAETIFKSPHYTKLLLINRLRKTPVLSSLLSFYRFLFVK